jgi:hypothetical protein
MLERYADPGPEQLLKRMLWFSDVLLKRPLFGCR